MNRQIWGTLTFGVFGLALFGIMGNQKPDSAREAQAVAVYAEQRASSLYMEKRTCDHYALDEVSKIYHGD